MIKAEIGSNIKYIYIIGTGIFIMKKVFGSFMIIALMLSFFSTTVLASQPTQEQAALLTIEKAKAGDKESIEKLKGLDMFNKEKVKKAMSEVRLTEENSHATIAFADGSSIEISSGIQSGYHYYDKNYYYTGIVFGQMRLNWTHTSNGYIMQVINSNVTGWCEGGFSDQDSACIINNDNPVTIWGTATFSPLYMFSQSMSLEINHYLNGDTYETY